MLFYFLENIQEDENINEEKCDENNKNEDIDVIEEEQKEQNEQEKEDLSNKEEFDLPEEKDHEEDDAKLSNQTTSDVKNTCQDNVQSMDTDHSSSADKVYYFETKIK